MPEIVKRKYLGEFPVYTKEEADALKLEYLPWHECEEGQWAISDDGYVAKVYSKKSYSKKLTTGVEIKTCFGIFWYEVKDGKKRIGSKCLYLERKAKRSYCRTSNKTFGERMVASNRMRRMFRIVAHMMLNGGVIDYDRLGQMFFKNHLIPALSVKTVLKKKAVMEYVMEQTEKQLAKWGIDDEVVIKRCFMGALEIAEQNKDADILLRIGKELATLKNMYPNKKIVTNELQISRNTDYVENMVDKIEEKLNYSVEAEIVDNE